ncbi:penicillin acylase family protein [Falsiroseomonas bella]|uniref:Penicillin acylase family protein n=1 Tax=Falsiroseomonas bella TaxID=2184016 RepID=A0A317FE94_9PROT|nr:penicillin acylase family protein [Falsiroseomonas bella]PWS37380.1 penicillin acylase family protein [Falsiroseomonas bella]
MRGSRKARAALLLALSLLPGCSALSPRQAPVDQRIAAMPVAGAPVSRPVEIRWNDHMVPWITAETDEDLAVALGLVHGHLRGAQVMLMRLIAQGRLSEVAGPPTADVDHALRILGFGRAAPQIVAAWPPETRRFVQAFLRGLNHALRNGPRPPEAGLLGLGAEDITEEDLLAVGRLAGTDINWLAYLSLLPQRGQPGFAELWARTREAGGNPVGAQQAGLLQAILEGTSRSGSNTVAVGAARSATGGALIASDPHLGLNMPNLWLVVGMRSPSFHAVGLMVPGLPILGVGRNPHVAWGGTNLRAASSDLFDVSTLPPEAFRTETARIRQRLWFTTERSLRVTPLGPVMTDAALLPANGATLALRWAGHKPTDEITALLRAARATDGDSFRDAFAGFGVSAQTMLWADSRGRVGRFIAATLPDRAGFPAQDFVLDARDPAATEAWARLRDARTLPAETAPTQGALASANNRPRWAERPGAPPLGFFFSDDDRVLRLEQLLAETLRHTPESMAAIQRDIRSPRAALLAAGLNERLAALPGGHPAPRLAAALAGWQGDYAADSRAPVAFEALLRHLVPALVPESRRDATGNPRGAETQWNFLTAFLLRDLDALDPARRESVLRQAARAAQADHDRLGTWGEMHRLRAAHWLVNLPALGRFFVYADYPTGGSRETPMKTSHGLIGDAPRPASFGSMARHVSDMADPDANWFTLWGGQDGWIGSAAFMDQVPLWREGRSIRVPLRPESVAAEFPRVSRIVPR